MKKYILTVLTSVVALAANADRISPRMAAARLNLQTANEPTLVKSQNNIYIFSSKGKNYITSADTDGPAILGIYDDTQDEPVPGLQWLMDAWSESMPRVYRAPIAAEAIGPLMSTLWGQFDPYNSQCPIKDGYRCVTGCTSTAIAQVMRRIGGENPKGTKPYYSNGTTMTFVYDGYTPNYSIMPDVCTSQSQTGASEVAKLMLAVGVANSANYTPTETGAYESDVIYALTEYFGYDPQYTALHKRDKYTQTQWEEMLIGELRAGRPVFYTGGGGKGRHAFVVDGYDGNGLWHINWGWDGMDNGWFALTQLEPPSWGSHFSSNQMAITTVPYGDPNPPSIRSIRSYCTVTDGNKLSVMYSITGTSVTTTIDSAIGIYPDIDTQCQNASQPLACIPLGELELKTSSGYTTGWTPTIASSSVNLPAGAYRLYGVWKYPSDQQWSIADPMGQNQQYSLLTIGQDGTTKASNLPDAQAELTSVAILEEVGYQGKLLVRYTVANKSRLPYTQTRSITITDKNNKTLITHPIDFNILPGTIQTGIAEIPLKANYVSLTSGDYSMSFMSSGQIPFSILSTVAGCTKGEDAVDISTTADYPSHIIAGQNWPHTPLLWNYSGFNKSGTLELLFFGSSQYTPAYTIPLGNHTSEPGTYALKVTPTSIGDIPFGIYTVSYRFCGYEVSPRRHIAVGTEVEGISYIPVADTHAAVAPSPDADYSGTITIPQTITIDGNIYTVTAIAPEAFKGCKSLYSLYLPQSITSIGENAFELTDNMHTLRIASPLQPYPWRGHITPTANPSLNVYVTAYAFDRHNSQDNRLGQTYVEINALQCNAPVDPQVKTGETLSFDITPTPIHENINPEILQYVANSETPDISYSVNYQQGKGWQVNVTPNKAGNHTLTLQHAQQWLDPVTVQLTALPSDTNALHEPECETTEKAYDILGRQTSRHTNGIVISKNGKKIGRK